MIGEGELGFHAVALDRIGQVPEMVRALVGPALAAELKANPDSAPQSPGLFCLSREDRPVSWIRVWADHLTIDGRTIPWLWTGDLHTVHELRGQGLATHLQRESTRWAAEHGFGRGSVFSTDETLHIYRKLGYLQPGFASRTVLLRSPRPVLAAHLPRRVATIASTGLRPLAAGAMRAVAARCRRWAKGSTAERRGDADGPGIAAVIAAAERTMPVRFNISAPKLQWKIDCASPKGGPCVITVVTDDAGEPVGLAVTRTRLETRPLAGRYRDFQCTTLLDFLLARRTERAIQALLGHVVGDFLARGEGEIFQAIAYDPLVRQCSRRLGFLPAGRGMSFSCQLPPDVVAPAGAATIASWPVTHFSGDGPFF